MCRILAVKGNLSRQTVQSVLVKTAQLFAPSQPHGFGFTALGADGSIATGRYLDPRSFSGFRRYRPRFVATQCLETGGLTSKTVAIIAHGRTSTNQIRLENVHPFSAGSVSMVHNGILDWIGPGAGPVAPHGCDSEEFLLWLEESGWAWSKTAAHWAGYGVIGAIDQKTGTLTVAKCGQGRLSWAGNKVTSVFSTDSHDCGKIAALVGVKNPHPVDVNRETIIQFNGADCSVTPWAGFGSRAIDANWRASMSGGKYADTYLSNKALPDDDKEGGLFGPAMKPERNGWRSRGGLDKERPSTVLRKDKRIKLSGAFPDWEPKEVSRDLIKNER